MAGKFDKVIVTNAGALAAKYKVAGQSAIMKAVNDLIAADKARGLVTCLVALDDGAAMKKLGGAPVTTATDPQQNKEAVDAVYRTLTPDYIMLLGSIDVIPHQDLTNPLYTTPKGDDPDPVAYGDIPYACEAPYSRSPQDFRGPTRVVGRLPDITGSTDAAYLIGVLTTAATWKSVDRNTVTDYFAITAEIWTASTNLSTTNIFGNASSLNDVPPNNSNWPPNKLAQRFHFFNCHGSSRSSQFYGQPANGAQKYPIALDAAYVNGKISEGTVAAAEACYGGQLYAPSATQTQIGMCNTYLQNKAHGFFGSTTIAYGPSTGNAQADLICQFFLERVLAGSSLGRAALEARQKFVQSASTMDPSDIKTLAQFNLYGDPSVTPIESPQTITIAGKTSSTADLFIAHRAERRDRRKTLFGLGLDINAREPKLRRRKQAPTSAILEILAGKAREMGFSPSRAHSFSISQPRRATKLSKQLLTLEQQPSAYHVMFARRDEAPPHLSDLMLVIGREVGGRIVSLTSTYSR